MADTPRKPQASTTRNHFMILVTVGTTMPFDELLEEADRLAGSGIIAEELVCQSGQSACELKYGRKFVACPSLDKLIEQSSLVITHGGATVIQLLIAKKPFVAFPNPRGAGDHQTNFLREISRVATISWSMNVRDLERLISERRTLGPAAVNAHIPRASDLILSFASAP